MNDQITCPHCKKSFSPDEVFSHQMNEKIEAEKVRMREAAQKWKEEQQKKLNEELEEQQRLLQEKLRDQMKRQMDLQLRDAKNESDELQKQNKELQEQILEVTKTMRQLRVQDEQRRVEMEKKLAEEQEKMKEDIQKRVEEANHLKMLEMDKKLQDAIRANEEMKRRLEQGSQQMQGEVLELELENILRREFPHDELAEVKKGVNGADLTHIVKNNYGKPAGIITWEFKRTKAWSNDWVKKLKDDQRRANADMAVLVTQVLPPSIKSFGMYEGVWVGDFGCIVGLATILRSSLLKVAMMKSAVEGNKEKKDILWNYLTSSQFTNRMQAIADVYSTMREDLDKEKTFFKKKWAKQEMGIQKITDAIYEMHGELEGIMGKELAEIKGGEMLPSTIEENVVISPAKVTTDGLF
jgi:hypothetical protein